MPRRLAPAGLLLALSGCVLPPPAYAPPRPVAYAPPPPIPSMLAGPGNGKDQAAFEKDDADCRRATPAQPGGDNIYAECMISRGEVIQTTPYRYGPGPYYGSGYGYPYRRAIPYGYGIPPY